MQFFKFPIVPILFGFIFGILLQHFFNLPKTFILFYLLLSFFGVLFSFLLSLKKKLKSYFFAFFVLNFCLISGAFSAYMHNEINSKNHFSTFLAEKNILQGVVTDKLKPTVYYNKYLVKIISVNAKSCIGKVIFYIPKKSNKTVEVGNTIKWNKAPELLVNSTNPHQFNYVNYLQNQNVFHEFKYKDSSTLEISAATNFYYYIYYIKSKLLKYYAVSSFKKDNYNLLMALLFGEKTELSKELSSNYTQAGIIHILAISGMHLALIYQVLLWLTKPLLRLKKGKTYVFLLSLLVLWFYAILAGFSASIVRAAVMFSVIALAKILNRQSNVYNSLAVSAFILLVYNPNYLFDVGFQLSFAAVISIVVFAPFVRKYSYSKFYVLLKLKELLLVSLVAQVGVLPLVLYYFGQFPLLFLVANLIAIPLSGLILILGLVFLPFRFLLPKFSVYLSIVINCCIDLMNCFTAWIVHFDSFIIKNVAFHEVLVMLLYLVIACVVFWIYYPKIKNFYPILISILVFQIGFFILNLNENSNNEFVVFHVSKHNLLVATKNNSSVFYTDDFKSTKSIIENYRRGKFVKKHRIEPVKNVYFFKNKILCVDSLGVYNAKQKPDIVVLMQSPKINLKRLIANIKPKQIIADGSNYKSYVKLWQATCAQEKIPFHATAEKGFFSIK